MNSASNVICDYCKEPIESREELIVALNRKRQPRPLHSQCYWEALRKNDFRFSNIVNRGPFKAIAKYGLIVVIGLALIDLFIYLMIMSDVTIVETRMIMALLVFPPILLLFLCWKFMYANPSEKSRTDYESKLPEKK